MPVEVVGIKRRQAKLGEDRVGGNRGNAPGQIVIGIWDAAGVIGPVFDNDFPNAPNHCMLGAIDRDSSMHTAEGLFGIEGDVKTDSRYVPAYEASLEPHTCIIKHLTFI